MSSSSYHPSANLPLAVLGHGSAYRLRPANVLAAAIRCWIRLIGPNIIAHVMLQNTARTRHDGCLHRHADVEA